MDVYLGESESGAGRGVFAARDFQKGELILQTIGIVLPYQTMYSIQFEWDRHLEVEPPARYLNHSCDPNLGVGRCGKEGIDFIALRDIRKGEEVAFDYAMTEYKHYPRANPADEFDLVCHCKADNCRGRLGYFAELSAELKRKYRGFIAEYLVLDEMDKKALSHALVDAWHGIRTRQR